MAGETESGLRPCAAKTRREHDVELLARTILDTLTEPYRLMQQIRASTGIAHTVSCGEDAQRLLAHADTALYEAKAAGKRTFRVFTRPPSGWMLRCPLKTIEMIYKYSVPTPALAQRSHYVRGSTCMEGGFDLCEPIQSNSQW
ncbi:MAG: GGDEF domain-containing protein [Chromatiales bacterium]|nr:GGDEF domain-containing protein [Chromatiales bacterium]